MKSKIFIFYSCLILSLTLVIGVFLYFYLAGTIRTNTEENMSKIVLSISEQINLHIREMDRLSTEVMMNQYIQKSLIRLHDHDPMNLRDDTYLNIIRDISDNLFYIAQPFSDIYKIVVAADAQKPVFSSKAVSNMDESVAKKVFDPQRMQQIRDRNGMIYITASHPDVWPDGKTEIVFSITRMMIDSVTTRETGLVEVQKKTGIIDEICSSGKVKDGFVLVVDHGRNIIYPYTGPLPQQYSVYVDWCFAALKLGGGLTGNGLVKNSTAAGNSIVYYCHSGYTDWTVLYVLPESKLLEPVYEVQEVIIFTGIAGILLSLIIAYIIAAFIYRPINRLQRKVKNLDFHNLYETSFRCESWQLHSGTDTEIAMLNHAFDDMVRRLGSSVNEVMRMRARYSEAYFKALQAQINPHFLHNTIAIISVMAKWKCTEEICDICNKLTGMLRYSASSAANTVLEGEMGNISDYLHLMKFRYEQRLEFEIQTDESLHSVTVPRLILQPLVENSIMHGLREEKETICVGIYAVKTENSWTVSIRDNGAGFSREALDSILDNMARFNLEDARESEKNGVLGMGVGVINTYARLKIFFGEKLIFHIGNRSEGGTEIVIGCREV